MLSPRPNFFQRDKRHMEQTPFRLSATKTQESGWEILIYERRYFLYITVRGDEFSSLQKKRKILKCIMVGMLKSGKPVFGWVISNEMDSRL